MPPRSDTHPNRDALNTAYLRCLRGQITAPTSGKERVFFQAIMVLFMSSCMVTLNALLRQTGSPSVELSGVLYEYPIMFCIAFVVRVFVANPLVDRIVPHVPTSLSGVRRALAMTAINVGIMATIMTFFGTLVSRGPEGFSWMEAASNAPISVLMAFAVNFLAIGPLVKIAYTQAVKPRLLSILQRTRRASKVLSHKLHATFSRSGREQTEHEGPNGKKACQPSERPCAIPPKTFPK